MKVPKHSAHGRDSDDARELPERRARVTHRLSRRSKTRAPRWFVLAAAIMFLGTVLYPSASDASPSRNHAVSDNQDCAISFFTICVVSSLPINITWPWATPTPTARPAGAQNNGHSSPRTPTPAPTNVPAATAAPTPVASSAPVKSNRPQRTSPTPVSTPAPTSTPTSTVKPTLAPTPSSAIAPVQITADQPSQPAVQSIAAADTNLNRGTPPRVDSAQPSATVSTVPTSSAVPTPAASSTELAIYAGSATTPAPVGYSSILAAVIAGFAAGVAVVVFFAGRRRGERQI